MELSRLNPNINRWAELPKDILFRIIKFLDLKNDLSRVRGVCPTWRSSLPLAEFPIHNKSHIGVPSLDERDKLPLFLIETRFYFFSPLPSLANGTDNLSDSANSSGWMVRMVENGTNRWNLLSPLFNINRDYLITNPYSKGEISLLDCRVIELAKTMSLIEGLDYKAKPISKKVVGEWDLTSGDISVVLVLLEKATGSGLRMLKTGHKEWIEIDEKLQDTSSLVHDIAFQNGKFFVYETVFGCEEWQLWIINPADCSKSLQFKSSFSRVYGPIVHLVPSQVNDCLYLLLKESTNHLGETPYKVERHKSGELVPMENLGDEVLFFADYVSFTVHNSVLDRIPQWKSISLCQFSSVNFSNIAKDCTPKGEKCVKEVRCWFNKGCFKYFVMKKGVLLEKEKEECDGLFFPLPGWLKWCCPFNDNVEVKLDGLRLPVNSESDCYHDDWCHYDCGCGISDSDDEDGFDNYFMDYYSL